MRNYLILLVSTIAFGQTPFSKENQFNTLAVKGIGYVNLLDGGYGSILGLEKGFLKNQSVGAKFIYNFFTPHQENSDNEPENYTDNKDRSIVIEYKYYFNFNAFRERTGISFYISMSFKTGKNTIDNDRDFPHDFYHRKINYNYFGPAVGSSFVITESKRWTIDTQISYLFGKKKVKTLYEVPTFENVKQTYTTEFIRFEIMVAYNINW